MRIPILARLLILVLLAGCADRPNDQDTAAAPTAPAPTVARYPREAGLFFPLEIGNHWDYERLLELRFIPDDPSTPPPEFLEPIRATATRDVAREEIRDGRTWRVIDYLVHEEDDPGPIAWPEYYRQDRSGLYGIDPPIPAPVGALAAFAAPAGGRVDVAARFSRRLTEVEEAAVHRVVSRLAEARRAVIATRHAAPGGVAPGEFTWLLYPIHPGQAWNMREEGEPFLITREVDGSDLLRLESGRFPAWRIRHDLPGIFGPNDAAEFWYGRDGFAGYRLHVEMDWTDGAGGRLGMVVGEEREMLADYDLVMPGR